ncbi:hypothetical protein GCM10010136_16050 [Limoniibacter endophyticus]|uniref:YlxR domain-containing protein n=1 Tax=Limoniibacter endophyticus TaxID=1565040 RepID=A0A8J3GI37_9HYPH|nr:hypothetical protein GCM10010136_16050 [Limoniibacter endophyticus]
MNERTCIVTRKAGSADDLIRFVVAPDDVLVPDLKRDLPGRGCWVTADRKHIEIAVAKGHFSRALKCKVDIPADLPDMIDGLLARSALGSLGLARKAGQVVTGGAKIDQKVRSGEIEAVLHATEAAEDGVRKITNARTATFHLFDVDIPAYSLFSEAEMSLALGGTNVIHAALLASKVGRAALKRMVALDRYRGGTSESQHQAAALSNEQGAAKDTDTE